MGLQRLKNIFMEGFLNRMEPEPTKAKYKRNRPGGRGKGRAGNGGHPSILTYHKDREGGIPANRWIDD